MSGSLDHSPADIVCAYLVAQELGSFPEDASAWPISVPNELLTPNNTITIRGTAGLSDGRLQLNGEVQNHEGIQIRVRSSKYTSGYTKANAIKVAIDGAYAESVTIDGTSYTLHNISRTTDIIELGTDPSSKCELFTLNAVLTLHKQA